MNKMQHVYVTYIASSAERVWHALTDGDTMRNYWNGAITSDWKPGSRWEHHRNGDTGPAAMGGTIVEALAPRRLVMTWAGLPDDTPAKRSRVSFEIEPVGEVIRLTVTHAELDASMAERVNGGWPRVLAGLKTLLETGRPLDVWGQSSCGSPATTAQAAAAPTAGH
jgi:uncharacterized protein YndB with AHSA1/START domain